jgi:hypothetical protein
MSLCFEIFRTVFSNLEELEESSFVSRTDCNVDLLFVIAT